MNVGREPVETSVGERERGGGSCVISDWKVWDQGCMCVKEKRPTREEMRAKP